MLPPKKRISLAEALPRVRTFCNYRDRCHQEVKEKLFSMGLWKKDVEQAIALMIEEGLLNEERFARSYARGHFYNKKWGKQKITMELKARQINDRLIEAALSEIDEGDHHKTINDLVIKKLKELKGTKLEKKQKITRYLLQKGYRYNEFADVLDRELSVG